MTGLFDLASPLLTALDRSLAPLIPPAGRLAVWGLVAASLSMALYAVLSPQQRLREGKAAAAEARFALEAYEGQLKDAMPLIVQVQKRALAQLGLVLGPAVLASLPILFMIVWLSGAYGHFIPESVASVRLSVEPPGMIVRWLSEAEDRWAVGSDAAVRIEVSDPDRQMVERVELTAAVTSLHKRRWWNLLIANPIGYLPPDGALERIEIALPRQDVLGFGPDWLRGWESVFFTALVAASLGIKAVFRLV
ncbi:hypothetical protein [Pelagibius sp.]|uniref:hypothetical protein n=1 Tax=Pelagibius sp. TaxID=1931238 RepID=UPI002628A407|nr:hypothetical protein [Pelagibius sp.]